MGKSATATRNRPASPNTGGQRLAKLTTKALQRKPMRKISKLDCGFPAAARLRHWLKVKSGKTTALTVRNPRVTHSRMR
jgi:hypothetical protein